MGNSLERFRNNKAIDIRVAARQYSRAELEVYGQQLAAHVEGEVQRIWADETADVIAFAAEREMAVADELVKLADGSAVKQQIVASRLQLMTNINTRRLSRFGA